MIDTCSFLSDVPISLQPAPILPAVNTIFIIHNS